jgi:hypothetical protein
VSFPDFGTMIKILSILNVTPNELILSNLSDSPVTTLGGDFENKTKPSASKPQAVYETSVYKIQKMESEIAVLRERLAGRDKTISLLERQLEVYEAIIKAPKSGVVLEEFH